MVEMKDFLDNALQSPRGIAVQVTGISTRQLRKQFYALREQLRAQGCQQYDCLSFIPRRGGELHIIRRDALPMHNKDRAFAVRQLEASELPLQVLVRGKHKQGLIFMELLQGLKL